MEKFIKIFCPESTITTETTTEPYDADALILNVDEAMTLAEKLVEFVAEYRQGNTCNPLPYEVRGVLQDIGTTLKTNIAERRIKISAGSARKCSKSPTIRS